MMRRSILLPTIHSWDLGSFLDIEVKASGSMSRMPLF